jgi:hypothetical protein
VAENLKLQGRVLEAADVENIRGLIGSHPRWSRWRISKELAGQWNWHNGAGQLKDMAARSLLLKLNERQLIQLPPRRRQPINRMRRAVPKSDSWNREPIDSCLRALRPLEVREISGDREARGRMAVALAQFHYLGYGGTVGENLHYEITDRTGRTLGFVLFGAAAWKCQDRDRHIGWENHQREGNLGLIANNSRFLLLPWVRVPHLASWILSRICRRVSSDCRRKYGHGLALLETFVERDRFLGTAYQAANWLRVGATTGRTRQDRYTSIRAPIKDIYLCPLRANFREILCR